MGKILVVDDEKGIRDLLYKYGTYEGYEVVLASDGQEAVSICQTEDFDVIIMDIMMPLLDGISACKQIKKVKDIPVIMLSARGEEYDKIIGFQAGVDDYVVKPFSVKELFMRVSVVINRNTLKEKKEEKENAGSENFFQYKDLIVDYKGRRVLVNDVEKEMTFKEYELLTYLIKNKNIAVTREQIISNIWGYDYDGDDRTLDTHIKKLRNALGEYRDIIVTLRGVGYRFDVSEK